VYEALRDPKTWLFALVSATAVVPLSVINQRQIIVASFGFSPLQTTLLGCVDGVVTIITIYTGTLLAARFPNSRCYVVVAYTIPNIIAVFTTNLLPWSNKIGLLFSQWAAGNSSFFCPVMNSTESFTVPAVHFVLSVAWLSSVTAGHTKRITVNAIAFCAYCIGYASGPFMWQAKYYPRYLHCHASSCDWTSLIHLS